MSEENNTPLEETAKTPAKTPTKSKAKTAVKGESQGAQSGGMLQSIGKDLCKRHGLAKVWVTSDGQGFVQENDAKAYAVNLKDKKITEVKG